MGSSSMMIKSSIVVAFLCVVIGGRVIDAAVSCNQVIGNLTPCVQYVVGGGKPPANCCNGVKNLNKLAQTMPERQAVCQCLKSVLGGVSYSSQAVNNAAALPVKCGIKLPYEIDPRIDCRTIRK